MTMLGQRWVNHTWRCCANVGPPWGQRCNFQKGNWLYTLTNLLSYMLSLKNANGGNVLLLTTSASNHTLRSHLFLTKKCVHQKCYKLGRQDKVAQHVLSPLLHLFLTGQKEITMIHYCFPVHDMNLLHRVGGESGILIDRRRCGGVTIQLSPAQFFRQINEYL